MRTFLLCLLLLLGQCPGLSLAGPVSGLPVRTKPLEKSALPSPPDGRTDLYVSAESVLSMVRKKQDLTLVDVRDTDSFERFSIPGSIHVPLYAVKTKPFLKNRILVLVHEGYPDVTVERACKALRLSGFRKVRILRGGVVSWARNKGPIQGDLSALSELDKVPSQTFFQKRDSREWLVIDISADHQKTLRSIPRAVHVPWSQDRGSFVTRLKSVLGSKPGSPSRFLLICAAKQEDYAGVSVPLQEAGIKNAFYLKGGLAGYETFLRNLTLLARPEKKTRQGGLKCFDRP
jgi:rhodanese-related sulfurtransferase